MRAAVRGARSKRRALSNSPAPLRPHWHCWASRPPDHGTSAITRCSSACTDRSPWTSGAARARYHSFLTPPGVWRPWTSTPHEIPLDALQAASVAGRLGGGVTAAAEAARLVPQPDAAPSARDLLLAGLAVYFTDGYTAGAPPLKHALSALRDEEDQIEHDMRRPWSARRVAPDLFDDQAWQALTSRNVQRARDAGALGVLPLALNALANLRIFEGELDAASVLLDEADAIADATGNAPMLFGRPTRTRTSTASSSQHTARSSCMTRTAMPTTASFRSRSTSTGSPSTATDNPPRT